MKNATLVQFLTYLSVRYDNDIDKKIVLVEAKGFSHNASVGVPKLTPVKVVNELADSKLFELDFKIDASESVTRENLDWDLKVVYEFEKLPKNICGIKVNAAENADICLF